jgi:uncharacterized protein with PIN domain
MTYQFKNKNERIMIMKKKKVDKCLKVTREMNEEMKMDEEQIVLLWNMLSDENKASFEKCFYCQMYVDKVHATIITPPIEETIDGWISEYYDSDETENTSLFEFMCTKIKQVVLIDG